MSVEHATTVAMEPQKPLPLLAINHISRVVEDLEASFRFYSEVLGFFPVKRPSSFDFEGAWLFNYGVGLHLIKGCPPKRPSEVIPKSCHLSFQTASLEEVESSLLQWGLKYVKNVFVEDGIQVGQLFFHDPDNNMIEVCTCDKLPVVPLTEGALACAARPALGVAATAVAIARPPAAASTDGSSDDGSTHGSVPASYNDVSFSHSQDACNMSLCSETTEMDE